MLENERKKLEKRNGEYLSIGITTDGKCYLGPIPIPWEQTTHAFNMETPDVFLSPEDLNDNELMKTIKSFHVVGCYILTELDDYKFISELSELRDLYIINGINVKDLSFISCLGDLHMLHLERAHLDSLEPIYHSVSIKNSLPYICLNFAGCSIEDVSALKGIRHISELIIICEDNDNERARWENIPAHTNRYYTIKR